jgi:MFS family permease
MMLVVSRIGGFSMSFYEFLVFIHVFSAILGMGPGFMMILTVSKASNLTELRHSYKIRNRLHIFTMVGGTLLLISGLLMGAINNSLFHQGWYVTSLILFLIALAFGPLLLSPRSKPIKQLLKNAEGDLIPVEYEEMSKKLFFFERIENIIFLIVIALMIVKPF